MIKKNALIIIFILIYMNLNAKEESLSLGLRFQKSVGLYYENGLTFQYSNPDYLYFNDLEVGFSYFSSRFGSAISSNAISQDNFIFNATYSYLPFWYFEPNLKVNLGYFYADYESDIFDVLDNKSFLFSLEFGTFIITNSPLRIDISMGYNLITGDGMSGAGTLYPVFYQLGITWEIFHEVRK